MLFRSLLLALLTYALVRLGQLRAAATGWDGESGRPARWFGAFAGLPAMGRELYVFCDDDPVCDPRALAALVDRRAGAGVRVERLRFGAGESGHVAHMSRHRGRYAGALVPFLAGALGP